MFLLPAYDPTAMAMLGFGILAVLGLPFIFLPTAQGILRHHSRWLRRAVVYRISHVLPSSAQPHSAVPLQHL